MSRPSVADVDLDALARNTAALVQRAGPAEVCAVVKADGYGHGAVPVARTVVAAGATRLAVALVEEAAELRVAGVDVPIVLLSQPPAGAEELCVRLSLQPTVYTATGIAALSDAAVRLGGVCEVHLKVDTGMRRVGAPVADAAALAQRIVDAPGLRLVGTCTHLAVADEPANPETRRQVERFETALATLVEAGVDPGTRHVANTAGLLTDPDTLRYDMVRPGIGLYGIAPAPGVDGGVTLEPVMSLRSEVSHVARHPAGTKVSYGHRHELPVDATVATVPLGYADGVRRNLTGRLEVLIGGRRRPVIGTITMDQFLVDCGDDVVAPGDPVVCIGRQGDEVVTAEEWAGLLDTIGYEITCGIGARVPRRHHGGPPGAAERA